MNRLKIASLHCFGSNPRKHATQKSHFVHCAQACAELAEWVYPAGPNRLDPDVVRNLLKNEMGCTDAEVEAFGLEEPRCWFRFTDNRYVGLEASMDYLADVCRRERPDGIAGYSNGGGAAQLVAAYPGVAVGHAFPLYVSNLAAAQDIALAGGAGVTLVGNGTIAGATQKAGSFLLVFTNVTGASEAADLVRVG